MTQASRSKNKSQVYFHLYRAAARTARSFAFVGCLALSIAAAGGQTSGQIPVITSAASASTIVGFAFSYQVTASASPTRYGATSLPSGLTLNATTGRISGVLAVIDGAYNATVSATNAGGTGVRVLGISVAPARPVITSAATAAGRQGIAFAYKIAATNFPRTFTAIVREGEQNPSLSPFFRRRPSSPARPVRTQQWDPLLPTRSLQAAAPHDTGSPD